VTNSRHPTKPRTNDAIGLLYTGKIVVGAVDMVGGVGPAVVGLCVVGD
jgi:hypothetical protein